MAARAAPARAARPAAAAAALPAVALGLASLHAEAGGKRWTVFTISLPGRQCCRHGPPGRQQRLSGSRYPPSAQGCRARAANRGRALRGGRPTSAGLAAGGSPASSRRGRAMGSGRLCTPDRPAGLPTDPSALPDVAAAPHRGQAGHGGRTGRSRAWVCSRWTGGGQSTLGRQSASPWSAAKP